MQFKFVVAGILATTGVSALGLNTSDYATEAKPEANQLAQIDRSSFYEKYGADDGEHGHHHDHDDHHHKPRKHQRKPRKHRKRHHHRPHRPHKVHKPKYHAKPEYEIDPNVLDGETHISQLSDQADGNLNLLDFAVLELSLTGDEILNQTEDTLQGALEQLVAGGRQRFYDNENEGIQRLSNKFNGALDDLNENKTPLMQQLVDKRFELNDRIKEEAWAFPSYGWDWDRKADPGSSYGFSQELQIKEIRSDFRGLALDISDTWYQTLAELEETFDDYVESILLDTQEKIEEGSGQLRFIASQVFEAAFNGIASL